MERPRFNVRIRMGAAHNDIDPHYGILAMRGLDTIALPPPPEAKRHGREERAARYGAMGEAARALCAAFGIKERPTPVPERREHRGGSKRRHSDRRGREHREAA